MHRAMHLEFAVWSIYKVLVIYMLYIEKIGPEVVM